MCINSNAIVIRGVGDRESKGVSCQVLLCMPRKSERLGMRLPISQPHPHISLALPLPRQVKHAGGDFSAAGQALAATGIAFLTSFLPIC
jgi:hypothetical protein